MEDLVYNKYKIIRTLYWKGIKIIQLTDNSTSTFKEMVNYSKLTYGQQLSLINKINVATAMEELGIVRDYVIENFHIDIFDSVELINNITVKTIFTLYDKKIDKGKK